MVSTVATRHSPFTKGIDFETMVFDFLGYQNNEDGCVPQPLFEGKSENPHPGLGRRLMERDGATPETAKNFHYNVVDTLAHILETEK